MIVLICWNPKPGHPAREKIVDSSDDIEANESKSSFLASTSGEVDINGRGLLPFGEIEDIHQPRLDAEMV